MMMNCRACGTPLPQGVAHCPQCGVATPHASSTIEAASDDPTVASSPEMDVPPPPPPTMYGSPSYYNPYESYGAAPSAPPPLALARPSKRIGLIIGVLLLVLLLLGSGVFVWLEYSTIRNAAAATAQATTTAQAIATAQTIVTAQAIATAQATATAQAIATATAIFTANGTFMILNTTTNSSRQEGQNKISSYTQHGVHSGDLTGAYTNEETFTLYSDNTGTFSGKITCTCAVEGRSGTLLYSITGTRTANGSFQGQMFDVQGTGDLAKLHGQGVFQGRGLQGTYSMQLHFDA